MEFPIITSTTESNKPVIVKDKLKLYSIISLLVFLIISIPLLALLIANGHYEINNLRISNLTGKSASITWETTEPTYSRLKFKEGSEMQLLDRFFVDALIDDRDEVNTQTKRRTHIVTLNNLNPTTDYYFSIGGDILPANNEFDSITMFPISSRIESPQPIFGQIELSSGKENLNDILIHYFVYDPLTNGFSASYTAIPNDDGNWAGEVTSMRDNYGAMYFNEGEISALVDSNDNGIPKNVLGLETESSSYEGGVESEYIQVSASNGKMLKTTFVPLTSSLTTEIISNFLDDQVKSEVLGTDIYKIYEGTQTNSSVGEYQTLAGFCSSKGVYTKYSCTNIACPTGRNCTRYSLVDPYNTLCLSRTTSSDEILDCCALGYKIVNGACVPNAGTPTPVPVITCNYGANTLYSCNYELCPSGRHCATNYLQNSAVSMCLVRTDKDYLEDCCAAGFIISNGKCISSYTPTPSPTPVPVITCNYGQNPKNSCNYEACPYGRNCASKSLQGAAVSKCLSRGTYDVIYDCCPANYTIDNNRCVAPVNTKTPTPTPATGCAYGENALNKCSAYTPCPNGRNCAPNALQNAENTQCLNRSDKDYIADCCASGFKIINNQCVPESGTPTPTTNPVFTPTVAPTITFTLTPTPAIVPAGGCQIIRNDTGPNMQAKGQKILDEQVIPYISNATGLAPFKIQFLLMNDNSSGCSAYNLGYIKCHQPTTDYPWLTNKVLFHEAMHQFKKMYHEGSVDTATSELMASIMEDTFVSETCMGGEYSFYGLGDTQKQHPRSPGQIRSNSGLSAAQLWDFAVNGTKEIFTESVVNRILPGGWKYTHLFCNGYKQFNFYTDGPGCQGDQLATIPSTFNVKLGIDIAPININDYDNGQYRIDLKYKTLTNNSNESDVTVPVKLASQSGCSASDSMCEISNVDLPGVYTDKTNSQDSRYFLNISLNSDIKNDLNCWNTSQNISEGNVSAQEISMQLDLKAMTCNYSFGSNPIGGSCNIADIGSTGIVAPWQIASGTYMSQGFSNRHPGIDVQGNEGSPLVAAGDGVVAYVRTGDVKDDIFFNQEPGGIKCEEGSRLNPDDWLCVCDWCPLEKVQAGAAKRKDLCTDQRDCVARAQALQSTSPSWQGDGALHRIYGNAVIIEHANHKTVYAHMGTVAVNVGDCVTAGQVIGIMSSTGSSSGRHIHFEVRANGGSFLNPRDFKCNGSCGFLNALDPLQGIGIPQYLGLTSEEHDDFAEGDIILNDITANALSKGIYKLTSPVTTTKNVVVKDLQSTPKFYIDKNKNSKFDEGEQQLGANIVGAEFTQIAALQDVTLNQTWNLVSFNAVSNTTVTTRDIANQAELSGLKLQMASYDTDLWTMSALKKEGVVSAFYGNQYNLVPGKAFFLKTDADGIYYNSGKMFSNINKELNVDVGWNFFSLSKDVIDSATLTSYKLLDKCKEAGITCKIFSDYNGQLENTILVKDIYYGKDYPIVPNKGYILKVESSGTIKF